MGYTIKIMTDEKIRQLSHGQVRNYGNYNFKFRIPKPVNDGLFCPKIFGPIRDYTCNCDIVKRPLSVEHTKCGVCGVDHVKATERANRFGHVEIGCYYVNPIAYPLVGSIIGLGSKALKALSVGEIAVKLVETHNGPLHSSDGSRYSIEVNSEGDINSINKLISSFRELEIDGYISMMESRSTIGLTYFKSGYSLYDLFNKTVLIKPPEDRNIKLIGDRVGVDEINVLYARLIRESIRISSISQETEETISADDKENIVNYESQVVQKLVNMLYVDGAKYGSVDINPVIESIKGKGGLVRGNLLGKRVDFSGRSVITSGPQLPIDSVGLPIDMVHELVKPIIIRELIPIVREQFNCGIARAMQIAIREVNKKTERTMSLAEGISRSIKVLMNRAPSLHRYSAMTFNVKVHYGKCIFFPPLACAPFNADFDGDTLAVHLILSDNAYEETKLTDIGQNLMSSADFDKPNVMPSHELVVGAYLLSV